MPPPNALYVSPVIYEWAMDEELMAVALMLGHTRVAYDAAIRCILHMPQPDTGIAVAQNILANTIKCP